MRDHSCSFRTRVDGSDWKAIPFTLTSVAYCLDSNASGSLRLAVLRSAHPQAKKLTHTRQIVARYGN